jgi:hypothetical protein
VGNIKIELEEIVLEGIDWIGLVERACECGNEPSGPRKY